jgi:CYTH domain-containing protein
MPTENERKFVIDLGCEEEIAGLASKKYLIAQGYMVTTKGITVRARKRFDYRSKDKNHFQYYFTLKANAGGRCVEIEDRINERDFNDLWSICRNKLEKIRYVVTHRRTRKPTLDWELDFFKDHRNETYFALAEIELPEGKEAPDVIPDFVKNNLLFEVPLTDNRFGNKLLGDARYAANILQDIKSANFKDMDNVEST